MPMEPVFKVAVAGSAGGHLVQARELKPAYEAYDYFYLTFSGGVAEELAKTERVFTIPNVVRSNPLTWIGGAVRSAWIAVRERPDVVITTGAGVVLFFCLFAKLLGAKIVFLESMAKVNRPTLTGRCLYRVADVFLVQWPQLLKFYPRARFVGRLF